ncbi:MAG: hypothetical protein ABSD74_00615 [Rhizomicrobium sp.]
MSRTLFIHVGPAKTGTSALQAVLREHDNSIVIYPKTGQWKGGAHHDLVFNFYGDSNHPDLTRERIDVLFDGVAHEAQQSERPVFVSSEVLAARENAADFIRALHARLSNEFDVEILFVVRDYLGRAASDYNQRVRSYGFEKAPDDFLVQHAAGLCYEPMLQRVAHPGFRIRLIPYDPPADAVARILGSVGFPDDHIVSAPRLNESIDIKSLIATLAMNRVAPTERARRRIVFGLRKLRKPAQPGQMIFGREAIQVAESRFRFDRAHLRQQFGFDLLPPAPSPGDGSGFWITKEERREIAQSVKGSDPQIVQFRRALRQFVRESQDAEVRPEIHR